MTDHGTDTDLAEWQRLFESIFLPGAVLTPELFRIVDDIFGQENFTLAVLHAHLLVEKALNARLAERGIPSILLGPEGLEVHQKNRAFLELSGADVRAKTFFDVLNSLRNSVAHEFVDEKECIRKAFQRLFPRKTHAKAVEQAAEHPLSAVKFAFLFVALDVGIIDVNIDAANDLIERLKGALERDAG